MKLKSSSRSDAAGSGGQAMDIDSPMQGTSRASSKLKKTTGGVGAGRREEVTGHYAFGPTEDDAIIRQRLLTRTTTTRGEPPLKKLLKKFITFVAELDKDVQNTECDKLYKSLLQELNTFELPLLKTKAVIDANRREQQNFSELQSQLDHQIIQARTDIEDLKIQLEESKIERQHKEECEAIRRLIAAQPPRSETQNALTELETEISTLEAENTAATRTLELRKKQFALLLHAVESLQSTLEEEQNNSNAADDTPSTLDTLTISSASAAAAAAAAEPMSIDA